MRNDLYFLLFAMIFHSAGFPFIPHEIWMKFMFDKSVGFSFIHLLLFFVLIFEDKKKEENRRICQSNNVNNNNDDASPWYNVTRWWKCLEDQVHLLFIYIFIYLRFFLSNRINKCEWICITSEANRLSDCDK